MNDLIITAIAGILTAACCIWIFRPLRTPRGFFATSFMCALAALSIYMLLGNPGIPAHPAKPNPQAQADMHQEAAFMESLQKNPRDADAMIRLAALRVVQDRAVEGTEKLLDRASAIAPEDKRIPIIRSMMKAAENEPKQN